MKTVWKIGDKVDVTIYLRDEVVIERATVVEVGYLATNQRLLYRVRLHDSGRLAVVAYEECRFIEKEIEG
jgi:hypothetical protein